MERANYNFTMFFFISVSISSLFLSNALATQAEFEAINKLEEKEKVAASEVIVRPKVEYNAEDFRDPFQGVATEETAFRNEEQVPEVTTEALPSLSVEGVIWGGRFPQAIINNKVVKVGDSIEGAVVTAINQDGITVLSAGRQYNLAPSVGAAAPYKNPGGEDEPR